MRPVVVLGATGSIGGQALEVAERLGMAVLGLAGRRASADLAAIARRHPTAAIVAVDPEPGSDEELHREFGNRYSAGPEALVDLAALDGVTVINGVVGAAGLRASIAALEAGNRLGLANKESLVAGGPLVLAAARDGEMLPIDSEHSALFQCLVGEEIDAVRRLILTASGGPFRGRRAEELEQVTAAEALAHPTWNMGPRITVDSATLVNKGLEVIEAHFLFGLAYEQIDVIVHPQSVVHSLVEFRDGSLKAHVGATDMRIPIQYAMTYPARAEGGMEPFDLAGQQLQFEPPDRSVFPALDLAYAAGKSGGTHPAAFNAADEVAVAAFLDGRIGFRDIARVIEAVLTAQEAVPADSIEAVLHADGAARKAAEAVIISR